jgi:hypothetical protein
MPLQYQIFKCGFTVIIILCGDTAQNPGRIKNPCELP